MEPRLLAPNSEPRPLPLPSLELSVSSADFGEVDRLVGANASLSLPTGDAPLLLLAATSMVCEWCSGVPAGADVAESTRVASEAAVDSRVSEAIRGEERVK